VCVGWRRKFDAPGFVTILLLERLGAWSAVDDSQGNNSDGHTKKKASLPIDQEEGWRFKSTETADSYLEGAAAGAFSAVDFVEVFFDFLDFLVLEVDLSAVDLSSDANAPKLMERANMATMIKDSNFFMGLPP
jgi:hypothetical protein